MSVPPPQGLNEVDYEAIEAAVTETVRGRWFLNEFARRNRLAETRLLLDAMARLESSVAASQTAMPSVDPSVRLLVQRIKEIAGSLDEVARGMRVAEVDEHHWRAVEGQARAVGALMRSATPHKPVLEPRSEARLTAPEVGESVAKPAPRLPRADLPLSLGPARPDASRPGENPRLAALSGLDGMPLADKLALFR